MTKRKVYLAGSIEHSKDYGVGWRRVLKPAIMDAYPHIEVFDPTSNEYIGPFSNKKDLFDHKIRQVDGRTEPNPAAMTVARHFILDDIAAVRSSDLVVFNYCGVPTPGSSAEVTIAYAEGIPVITVLEDIPLEKVELWLMGCTTLFVNGGIKELLENLYLIGDAVKGKKTKTVQNFGRVSPYQGL